MTVDHLILGAHIPDEITAYTAAIGPEPDDVLKEMTELADAKRFPIVGPAVGGWLSQLARINGAERVFEFGSGFGYSAYWFARALPADGTIVLTDRDVELLEQAQEFFERGGVDDLAEFRHGDAVSIMTEYDDSFDIVLIDMGKARYAEAFNTVAENVPPGGIVLADNVMTAGDDEPDDVIDFDALRQVIVEGADLDELSLTKYVRDHTAGIVEYLETVRDHGEFETTLLPLGDGLTVSVRHRS